MERKTLKTFIAYSHLDDDLRRQLVKHLCRLVRNEDIDLWDDRRVAAGGKWREEIESALSNCDLALLLVSPDFFSSAFCQDIEVPELLRRHEAHGVRIVPIILRPCAWTEDDWIAGFEALPPDGKPVTSHRPHDRAFAAIARAIAELVKVPLVAGSPPSGEDADDTAFAKWWGQIDAAWPGDKGLLDDDLGGEDPQRRGQRWKQVEAVLEEFAEVMGRRAAVEIVCADFWYRWDDGPPTSLWFIQQKLREFRKGLSERDYLPETRGNEGWYRTRWDGFTGDEDQLQYELSGLQELRARGEKIGRILYTPAEGLGKEKAVSRDIREKDDPEETRASMLSRKPSEVDVAFYGAFSRLPEERKQAWHLAKLQLESAAELTLADVRRRWADLLSDLRRSSQAALSAFLREAVPISLDGDQLTLAFNQRFHYEQVMSSAKRLQTLAEAIARLFGRDITVKCQLAAPNGAGAASDPPTG